ncbi:MAG: hypothetical protein EA427_17625, partial [Spirochaetaceae bacterium]
MGGVVLTLDIGTSRTKVALYHEPGEEERENRGPQRVGSVFSAPTAGIDGGGSFEVDLLLGTVLELTRTALATLRATSPGVDITAVGVTSFLSHILLDSDGAVIGPGMSWSFQPSPEALRACMEACRAAGWRPERPLGSELLAPRLVHLARYRHDLARRVRTVVCLKDLVRSRLAGSGEGFDSGSDGGSDTRGGVRVDWSFRDYSLLRDR